MSKPMNILMVLADQHNAELLGCAGHPQALTPAMDRFAAEGMRFRHAYTQNTICTPSRTCILSGQYCHNHGLYGLSGPAPLGLNNLMRHCRSAGYRTAAFGKLHLPNSPHNWLRDDLDDFGDTYELPDGTIGKSDFLSYLEAHGVRELEDSWHNTAHYGPGSICHDARPSELPLEHTQEAWSARRAMEVMREAGDQPFCIQVSFQKPHHPLLPNERFWELYAEDLELPATFTQTPDHRPPMFQNAYHHYRKKVFAYEDLGAGWEAGIRRVWRGTLACVSQIDHVFGELLDFLDGQGLADNTIVIYSSDHGCYHTIHGIEEKAPGICSEAVCRVPMLWRVPGVTPAGSVCDQLVEAIDMTPTMAKLCDLPPMDTADGSDISALLRGEDAPVRQVAVTENAYSKALRWKQWRFVHYQPEVFPEHDDIGELYDLAADPHERRNLYHDPAHAETVHTCRRLLLEWLIRTTRVTTLQPADKVAVEGDDKASRTPGGSVRYGYPVAGDGRAPNPCQPRFREHLNANYI